MTRFALPCSPARAALVAVAFVTLAAPAAAHETRSSGGASVPSRPELAEARCADGKLACPEGENLKIKGEYLDTT